jgi:hypothetical protein
VSAPLASTDTPGVYKRGSRFVAIYRDNLGKQRSKSARTTTEAKRIRTASMADVRRGEYQEKSRRRFDEYAREWIDTYQGSRGRGLRETTRAGYRSALELRAIPYFGRKLLSEITTPDIQRYMQSLFDDELNLGNSAMANSVKPVRALFTTAVQHGLIRHNPQPQPCVPPVHDKHHGDDNAGEGNAHS